MQKTFNPVKLIAARIRRRREVRLRQWVIDQMCLGLHATHWLGGSDCVTKTCCWINSAHNKSDRRLRKWAIERTAIYCGGHSYLSVVQEIYDSLTGQQAL